MSRNYVTICFFTAEDAEDFCTSLKISSAFSAVNFCIAEPV
jgi:hypothetical protein